MASVTLDEVRDSLGESGDPFATNAAKIRKALGRGSYSTIQTHLNVLRERAQNEEFDIEPVEVPAAPNDLLEPVWMQHLTVPRLCFFNRLEH